MSDTYRMLNEAWDTGDLPDYTHADVRRAMADRSHSLGDNPAFPKSEEFGENLASEQYQFSLRKLASYFERLTGKPADLQNNPGDIQRVMSLAMAAIPRLQGIERSHAQELAQLAVELIFMQPEFRKFKEAYDAGEFRIEASIGTPDLSKSKVADEIEELASDDWDDWSENTDPAELAAAEQKVARLNAEVAKRKFINAMIQGAGLSKNYAFHLVQQELEAIDPKLASTYGLVMSMAELGYFMASPTRAAMIRDINQSMQAGSVHIEADENGVPVIRAVGAIFPVLIQELAKGLAELVSYNGLPQDEEMASEVINKADLLDDETWSILVGRGLWSRFVSSIPASEDEITMHLYDKIVQMPADQFSRLMATLQEGGEKAARVMQELAREVRRDIEEQDRDEARQAQSETET